MKRKSRAQPARKSKKSVQKKSAPKKYAVLPQHVAIILDGNGRWAQKRGLSRSEGHRAGGEALDRILDAVLAIGIPNVSLYAFSTENWKRPRAEVNAIWKLMREFFSSRMKQSMEKGIRVLASGDLEKLPSANQRLIKKVIDETADGKALTANFCVNYGSHAEIVHAVNELRKIKPGEPITESDLEAHLYTSGLPPVDLLVRPGGEQRISNFLLWQCAYAEMYFTPVLWPDFNEKELRRGLNWFAARARKFGGLLPTDS